ncbi:hypothetical protein OBBRIDRAFT_790147 [Obba rivulosa]|uniref:Golgi apparatus membrane protein TVP38 n=1 Tax=Obba rivulosa TaxID=1052685 RepID=A0A8E2J344_9APHY|nr:hypothetical protein OBBRIDRAFT_790147 [Obba rivulosa]
MDAPPPQRTGLPRRDGLSPSAQSGSGSLHSHFSPARNPSPSPPRHVQLEQVFDEKAGRQSPAGVPCSPNAARKAETAQCQDSLVAYSFPTTSPMSSIPPAPRPQSATRPSQARPSPYPSHSSSLASSWTAPTPTYTRPRGLRIANLLRPWIPIILYAITSLGFVFAIALWKTEVFQGLDALSHWLQSDELGYAVIFVLIFITTFPPIPLYSTLIILSGYTFGPWTGAIISYCASLAGALAVFILSRTFFRASISRWLSCTASIKRVVRAIEKRPKLLFLIRLAPYPYNVMNCLLAAAPSLTLRTYTLCTALSLFKLIIHTSIGASIHSFAEYHVKPKPGDDAVDDDENALGRYSTIAGIVLCVAIFFYLSYITRRAVDDELDGEDAGDSEERVAFLSATEEGLDMEEQMVETPFRLQLESRPVVQYPGPDAPGDTNRSGSGNTDDGL